MFEMKILKTVIYLAGPALVLTVGHTVYLEFRENVTPECQIRFEICGEKPHSHLHVPDATGSTGVIT